jgi:two-component system, LytTR family, response regulator
MENIRVVIIDDEEENRNILTTLLKPDKRFEIVGKASNIKQGETEILLKKPGLVFLDISLPPHTIFEMLQGFKNIDFLIIFVTAHHEYAIKAFEYSAVSYLTKPIDESLLEKALENVVQIFHKEENFKIYQTLLHNISNPKDAKICFPTTEGFDVVKASDIVYCQADSNYTFVYLQNDPTICVSKTLSDIENMLSQKFFFRIHKSFLINTNYIKKYLKTDGGSVIMQNGDALDVSRRKKQEFLELLQHNF